MPKRTKHPKLRAQSWRTAGGEVRTAYYYDMRGTGEKDIPLGTDYAQALRRWAEIHLDAPRKIGTLAEAFDRWTAEELPKYRATTLRDYRLCLTQLRPVFDAGRWADITLPVLRAYLRKRTAKTRANRELSVLQIVWHWARLEGLHDTQWPAAGMERSRWKNPEAPREFEVTPSMFAAVYEAADQTLRDAMDIASATGLRLTDVRTVGIPSDGVLRGQASKTGKRFAFDLAESPVLGPLYRRRLTYRADHLMLLSTPSGNQVSYLMLRDRWNAARRAAAEKHPKLADAIGKMFLRDMRKLAADLSPTLKNAAELLQHDSEATTRRHYRGKVAALKTVR